MEYGQVWFEENAEPPLPDILVCRQSSAPLTGARCDRFRSMVHDLTIDEQALWKTLHENCRYKIRRSEREGATSSFQARPSPDFLSEFVQFYREFAAQKALPDLDLALLSATSRCGRLCLSRVVHGNAVLAWHAHIVTGSIGRLLHSCSIRDHTDVNQPKITGRANRLLHWRDLLEFRQRGFTQYDWGGLFFDESVLANKHINEFKREFGGETRDYYDCETGLSARGRIYLPLRDAWRKAVALRSRMSTGGHRGARNDP